MKATLLLVLSVVTVFAQVQSGRIVGAVTDPNKAVIPNAQVIVTGAATNQAKTVATNAAGEYAVTPLDPGLYNVVVRVRGFQTTQVNDVEVVVGQSARVDVELKIGEVSSKVEVTSTTPLLNTESGTLGQVVTNTQIVNLPLNGRGFYELARLAPGATLLPGTGNLLRIRANYESGAGISGVNRNQLSFFLGGADVTDHHQGGTLIQTSIDALQEFQVQQSEYSAEFRNAGGMLNITTKPGTSEFHGGVFEFLRNDQLDARNFFLARRDILQVQSILVVRSGRPFTPTISRDVSNTGLGGQRPNRIGSGKLINPTIANWFDKTAFNLPATYTYGNSGADILREQNFKSLRRCGPKHDRRPASDPIRIKVEHALACS